MCIHVTLDVKHETLNVKREKIKTYKRKENMKKSLKTILIAAGLSLVFLFASCAGGGGLSGKYDSIVELGGYYTIAYKDGAQRVFKNGKAKGDKAFEISAVGRGDFFKAQKTAADGWQLMDKNAKFMKYTGPKLSNIGTNQVNWSEKNKKGVWEQKYEINFFAAYIDVSQEKDELLKDNAMAFMNTKGELVGDRYASIDGNGRGIALATRTEKAGEPAVNTTFTYALTADGKQIGRKVQSPFFHVISNEVVIKTNSAGRSIVSIKKEKADDNGNEWDVYDKDGKFISVAESAAIDPRDFFDTPPAFAFSKINADKTYTDYVILNDYSVKEFYKDVQAIYHYNDGYYFIAGVPLTNKDDPENVAKNAANPVKLYSLNETTLAGTEITKGYENLYDDGNYLLGEKGGKYDYMLHDGTAVASGVDGGCSLHMYNEYANDYGYIVKNGDTLEAKIAGGEKRTKTLTSDEDAILNVDYGAWIFSKTAAAGYPKIWLPYNNVTVDIVNSFNNGDDYTVIVKKDGKEYYYATLMRNLKYWDGNLLNGNLLAEVAGLNTEAQLETSKFFSTPAVVFWTGSELGGNYPKIKLEQSYAADIAADKAFRAMPREIGGGYIAYQLKKEDGTADTAVKKYALNYGLNDDYTKYYVKPLGEDESLDDSDGPFAVTCGTKAFNDGICGVYKVEANKKGALEIRQIVKDVKDAQIWPDKIGNYYIWGQAADGSEVVYSDEGKLMLRGGVFGVWAIENYTAIVSKYDAKPGLVVGQRRSDYGVIKLNRKGGYKVLANLEWYYYGIFVDGSFLLKAERDNKYAQLCNSSGKVLEKNAAVKLDLMRGILIPDGETLDSWYNLERIMYGGKTEYTQQFEVKTGAGVSKIFRIKIAEKSLDYSILNVLMNNIVI